MQSQAGVRVQGYLAHKKTLHPWECRRALGIGLMQVPRGGLFLMNGEPLYRPYLKTRSHSGLGSYGRASPRSIHQVASTLTRSYCATTQGPTNCWGSNMTPSLLSGACSYPRAIPVRVEGLPETPVRIQGSFRTMVEKRGFNSVSQRKNSAPNLLYDLIEPGCFPRQH